MTKDTFEDALIELREKEFDKKFKGDGEKMIGSEPKVIKQTLRWIYFGEIGNFSAE